MLQQVEVHYNLLQIHAKIIGTSVPLGSSCQNRYFEAVQTIVQRYVKDWYVALLRWYVLRWVQTLVVMCHIQPPLALLLFQELCNMRLKLQTEIRRWAIHDDFLHNFGSAAGDGDVQGVLYDESRVGLDRELRDECLIWF